MDFSFLKDYQTIIASIIGSFVAYKYYKNKMRLDKDIAKRELFSKFNERYNEINDHLEELVHIEYNTKLGSKTGHEKSLDIIWDELFNEEPNNKTPSFIAAAFDYLNLCSEQYYWYRKGYIDKEVWKCWHSGMKDWHKYSFFIKKVVIREKERNASYYYPDFLNLFNE